MWKPAWCLAELIAGVSKPSATLVLGGGHSIGIPLAVSAQRSFIVPSATMTVHPVRHSGLVLGVPQTLRYFEQMQQRITRFVTGHSAISARAIHPADAAHRRAGDGHGSVLEGEMAVREGLIDELAACTRRCATCTAPSKKGKRSPLKIHNEKRRPVAPFFCNNLHFTSRRFGGTILLYHFAPLKG